MISVFLLFSYPNELYQSSETYDVNWRIEKIYFKNSEANVSELLENISARQYTFRIFQI